MKPVFDKIEINKDTFKVFYENGDFDDFRMSEEMTLKINNFVKRKVQELRFGMDVGERIIKGKIE